MKSNAKLTDITIIITCLVLLELVFRFAAPLVSGNARQISEISDIATELAQRTPAILFLGNSLMGNALDLNEFDKQVSLNMSTFKVVPDSTSLWDWSCIIKNSFIDERRLPKVVVLGYAWQQVDPVSTRLGGFFCSVKDLPELINLGMNDGSDILEFLVSKASKLYAMHETVRKRILDIIIPDYKVFTQFINTERNKKRTVVYKKKSLEDYRLLNAYIKMLVENNIRPVVVAMPVKQYYKLDEAFFSTINQNGGMVLDYRKLDGIDETMFRDSIHLNGQGNKIFTKRIAEDLKEM